MERHANAAGDRLPVSQGRYERPLAGGDDRRFVQVGPPGLGDVHLRDVTIRVDGDGQHDIGVQPRRKRRRGIHGVDMLDDDGSLHVTGRWRLRPRGRGDSRPEGDRKNGCAFRDKRVAPVSVGVMTHRCSANLRSPGSRFRSLHQLFK